LIAIFPFLLKGKIIGDAVLPFPSHGLSSGIINLIRTGLLEEFPSRNRYSWRFCLLSFLERAGWWGSWKTFSVPETRG